MAEPYDIEAEQTLLSFLIRQPQLLDKVRIEPEAFFSKELRKIYQAILGLKAEGKPVVMDSLMRVATQYEFKPTLISTLVALGEDVSQGFEHYLSIVNDCLIKRRLAQVCNGVLEMINDGKDTSKILETLQTRIATIPTQSSPPRTISLKCIKVKQTKPPFYLFEVSGQGRKAVISLRSGQVLKRHEWTKAITDNLRFIPVLPKNFFDLVSEQIAKAIAEEAPEEAQEDKYLLTITRDFLNRGFEAEEVVDLDSRGLPAYITRSKYRWFKGETLYEALKTKTRFDKGEIWNILSDYGAQKKYLKFKGKSCWLWGMPERFFKEEPVEQQESLDLEDIIEELGEKGS